MKGEGEDMVKERKEMEDKGEAVVNEERIEINCGGESKVQT